MRHQVLLAIKATPSANGLPISQNAGDLLIQHNTAVGLVESGLARRHADPAEGRRSLVELTEQAETLLGALSAAHLRELRTIRPDLLALLRRF